MSDTLRYIIDALRQNPIPPGITREAGHPPRRMAGSLADQLRATRDDVNYTKYKRQQAALGETPVSYEDWMRGG